MTISQVVTIKCQHFKTKCKHFKVTKCVKTKNVKISDTAYMQLPGSFKHSTRSKLSIFQPIFFTHLGLIALSLPLSLMATTSDLGMTNCCSPTPATPLPTYLSLLARSSEFPPFTACSVLLLVEVPTDSQALVEVPTDSRVLVDTEMPTMDPVVLIGTGPADRHGISPAGLVGRPWGSWIVTSGSFACKYILAFCQMSFERF